MESDASFSNSDNDSISIKSNEDIDDLEDYSDIELENEDTIQDQNKETTTIKFNFDDCYKILKNYIEIIKPHNCQVKSFNNFLLHSFRNILLNSTIETDLLTFTIIDLKIEKVSSEKLNKTTTENFNLIQECVNYKTTYSSEVYIKILYYLNNKPNVIWVLMGRIPIMVGSVVCTQNNINPDFMKGYFIVKGAKKVICLEERINYNYPFLSCKKKDYKFMMYVEFKSINIYKSSLIDIGVKVIRKIKQIFVYCPDICLRELIPIQYFLWFFFEDNEVIKGFLYDIIDCCEIEKQDELINIISSNFDDNIDPNTVINFVVKSNPKYKNKQDVINALNNRFMIHMYHRSNNEMMSRFEKGKFTLYLLKYLLFGLVELIKPDDRDHMGKKLVYTVDNLFSSELYHCFTKRYKPRVISQINSLSNEDLFESAINFAFTNHELTNTFKNGISSNSWSNRNKHYPSQSFDTFNIPHYCNKLNKISTPVKSDSNKILAPRALHTSQSNVLCLYNTPDGKKIGLIKTLSINTHITLDNSINLEQSCWYLIKDYNNTSYSFLDKIFVLVNGNWIATIVKKDLNICLEKLKQLKFKKLLFDISVFYNKRLNSIVILSNSGRLMFPVVHIKNLQESIKNKRYEIYELIKDRSLIYLDKNESEDYIISEDDIFTGVKNLNYNYEYCHLSLLFTLGYSGSLIPFSTKNQGPRNIYNTAINNQAIGGEVVEFPLSHKLLYPQVPIACSVTYARKEFYESPIGCNVVLAIMPFQGHNQEDSIVFNQGSIDRGLFNSVNEVTYNYVLNVAEILCNPDTLNIKTKNSKISYNFDKLDKDGIIKIGEYVENNDVLIAIKKDKTNYTPALTFNIDYARMQVVKKEKVQTERGELNIILKLIEYLVPQVGDKFSSDTGSQKGLIGSIFPEEDMPFLKDGTKPDLILNSLCLPSRMTVGHLFEIASATSICKPGSKLSNSKYCSICVEYLRNKNKTRCDNDCILYNICANKLFTNSFYNDLIPKHIKEFESSEVYCGITGKKYETQIFIGVCYYLRLKHHARAKSYSRRTGATQILTRQPKEGRSVKGGHRLGVQEKGVLGASGAVFSLQDRIFINSDYYKLIVCKCGILHHGRDPKTQEFIRCKMCNGTEFYEVKMPFSTKVLTHMLMPMNIVFRFIPRKTLT